MATSVRSALADGLQGEGSRFAVFDSFGRSLELMEQNYTEPALVLQFLR